MPKSLVLGNGNILICHDYFGQIKDFYFDYVGQDNHMTEESVNRVGVWINGQISWLMSGTWDIVINYQTDTLVSNIKATNHALQVELVFSDFVYNEKNIFLRKVTVHNLAKEQREIKVFLNHQFRMYHVHKGDTVYFDPEISSIIHYKGKRIAIISGMKGKEFFTEWTVGLSNIEGKEGTWKDAEDGVLSKNPIEHGVVDSTIGFKETLDSESSFEFFTWTCISKKLEHARKLNKMIIEKTPQHLLDSTKSYWKAWANKSNFTYFELDDDVINLFKKSLLIMRTHTDSNGAIIASGDSDLLQYGRDNYSYVWHRDASFTAMALDKAGYHEPVRQFFKYSSEVISKSGYFYHKYRPDKSLGSSWHPWVVDGKPRLPIQEDETAIVLYALWQHYSYTKDIEFIEILYNPLIKKAADFLLSYRNEKKLPNPSYDLWESKYGIHTYTLATVVAGLKAASNFAEILGKEENKNQYALAAEELRQAFHKYMFNEKQQFYFKSIIFNEGQILHDETLDASSFYAAFRFGLVEPENQNLQKAFETFQSRLVCSNHIGGVVRFENDEYYRQSSEFPGNPWIITTLWLAQYHIFKAKNKEDLEPVKETLKWVVSKATSSGILPEQLNPQNGQALSASPLIWSHAEFVTTVIAYLEKLEDLGICKVCNPNKEGKVL